MVESKRGVALLVELSPPAGTLAYRRLLDELRTSGLRFRLAHGSASEAALKAEAADSDVLVIFDLEPREEVGRRLDRFLPYWAEMENPPRLYLSPKLGTNLDWLQRLKGLMEGTVARPRRPRGIA